MEAPISTQATHNRRQKAAVPLVHCFCRGRPRSALFERIARSRAAVLAPPSRARKIFGVEKGRPRSPPTEVVCEAGTMGWLTGRGRGGGRRARCRRASRRRWGANGRPRVRPGPGRPVHRRRRGPSRPRSQRPLRPTACPAPVSVPSMTAAARATRSSETPRAMRMPSMRSSAAICRASRSSTTCPSCTRMRRSAFWVMVTAERPSPR